MATTSYPAVGDNGFTGEQWAASYAGHDGITDDYTGNACGLTRNNTTDVCTIGTGMVKVNGYTLDITSPHDLPTPAVTSTTTYRIAAQYDPALNVEDPGGARSTLGPCRLIVTTAALDLSGGKQYVLLWEIVRSASQLLTAAPAIDRRRWTGPFVELPDYLDASTGTGPFPRGTLLLQTADIAQPASMNMSIRTINPAGNGLIWKSMTNEPAVPFPAPAALVANINDPPATMFKQWTTVYLQGTLRRSNGANLNTGSAVVLGTLPVGWRPSIDHRYMVLASGPTAVGVLVAPSGQVSMYDPPGTANVTYIQLDGITFRAE